MNQTRYNEADSLQRQHYQSESALLQQHYNQARNLPSNSSGNWDPYGGCCGSSGSSAGAAALGMVGGMALGATMESAATPRQPTIVENLATPGTVPIGNNGADTPCGRFFDPGQRNRLLLL